MVFADRYRDARPAAGERPSSGSRPRAGVLVEAPKEHGHMLAPGPSLRAADLPPEAAVRPHRHRHAGARHRRQHRGLPADRRRPAAQPAGTRLRTSSPKCASSAAIRGLRRQRRRLRPADAADLAGAARRTSRRSRSIFAWGAQRRAHRRGCQRCGAPTASSSAVEFFAALGVPAFRGRLIEPATRPRCPASRVVVSHAYWQREMGGRELAATSGCASTARRSRSSA